MGFKIVINKCYGGFGVSTEGIEWLLAKGADPAKVRVQDSGLGELRFVYTVCILERHDPLLVEMVETLGEAANGDSAALEVREIKQPLYRLNEHDGNEWIEEPDHVKWTDASNQGAA